MTSIFSNFDARPPSQACRQRAPPVRQGEQVRRTAVLCSVVHGKRADRNAFALEAQKSLNRQLLLFLNVDPQMYLAAAVGAR